MVAKNEKISLSRRGTRTINLESFTSSDELIKVCESRKKGSQFDSDAFGGTRNGNRSWAGLDTIEEAKELLRFGWGEEVPAMKLSVDNIKQSNNGKRITFKNNVVGFNPIVPLALLNVPESMIDINIKPIKSKVLELYYDCGMTCNFSPEDMLKCGRKLIQTVISLENQGYRVRLSVVTTFDLRDSKHTHDWMCLRVKTETQPLDLKRVMFPMIHPAMFRMIGFGWYERCPTSTYESGYGTSLDNLSFSQEDVKELYTKVFGKNAMVISAPFINKQDTAHIEAMIKGEYENRGKPRKN